jgi:hypothetical protein
MNTCATCKHWQPFRPGPHPIAPRGPDSRGLGLCAGIGQEDESHTIGLDKAQLTDLSGCAGLRTAADFGCTLHTP